MPVRPRVRYRMDLSFVPVGLERCRTVYGTAFRNYTGRPFRFCKPRWYVIKDPTSVPRRRRADAQRNVDALLKAARTVFDTSGVDAPAKEITDLAGVGVGTLYRHFPQRSDLVKAVVRTGIEAVAAARPG